MRKKKFRKSFDLNKNNSECNNINQDILFDKLFL